LCRLKTLEIVVPEDKKGSRPKDNCNSGLHGPATCRASATNEGRAELAEASLLFGGLYLLTEAALQPPEANQGSILSAAVTLALAVILLVYLVRPWRKAALARMEDSLQTTAAGESPLTTFGEVTKARHEAERVLRETDKLPGPM
jgi:hypothetical protein